MEKLSKWKLTLVILIFVICTTLIFFINTQVERDLQFVMNLLFGTMLYPMVKMILSFFYQPFETEPPKQSKVTVVIPSFNEDPDSVVESIISLTKQTFPIHEIIFVDDGSDSDEAYRKVKKFADDYNKTGRTNIITHRFKQNSGKKAAQIWGFKKASGNFFMVYDSDGTIGENTVYELMRPFADKRINAVVGHINARNVNDTFMTRLQDILYQSSFRVGRASQSVTGSVIVCSGANSMFRAEPIMENLDHFAHSKVFGIKMKAGDDRQLTAYALQNGGKTVYQSTAACITDVPISTGKFFKQQVRWAKSFYLGTADALTSWAWKRPWAMIWLVLEGFLWLVYGVTAVITLVRDWQVLGINLVIFSLGYLALNSLAGNVYYLGKGKNKWLYVISPIFGFVRMLLIYPIRLYALATIAETSWGTRSATKEESIERSVI